MARPVLGVVKEYIANKFHAQTQSTSARSDNSLSVLVSHQNKIKMSNACLCSQLWLRNSRAQNTFTNHYIIHCKTTHLGRSYANISLIGGGAIYINHSQGGRDYANCKTWSNQQAPKVQGAFFTFKMLNQSEKIVSYVFQILQLFSFKITYMCKMQILIDI